MWNWYVLAFTGGILAKSRELKRRRSFCKPATRAVHSLFETVRVVATISRSPVSHHSCHMFCYVNCGLASQDVCLPRTTTCRCAMSVQYMLPVIDETTRRLDDSWTGHFVNWSCLEAHLALLLFQFYRNILSKYFSKFDKLYSSWTVWLTDNLFVCKSSCNYPGRLQCLSTQWNSLPGQVRNRNTT